eukprot:COSAG01_NODE_2513_length_7533_cov_2.626446_1_plen_106_part_10
MDTHPVPAFECSKFLYVFITDTALALDITHQSDFFFFAQTTALRAVGLLLRWRPRCLSSSSSLILYVGLGVNFLVVVCAPNSGRVRVDKPQESHERTIGAVQQPKA